jgi:hypothetical protein
MWNQMMYKLFSRNEPGILTKDYTPNGNVDGPNCQGGTAYDLIYTAINSGNFGISRADPLLKYWFVGSSPACGTTVETTGTSSPTTVLPVDQNFPSNSNVPVIQLPSGNTNPPTSPQPSGTTNAPTN